MATNAVKRAAFRLRSEFKKARAEGYYSNGWYSYMDKADIEALVLDVLGPEALEPRVRVQVLNSTGEVIFETEAATSDLEINHHPDGSAEVEFPMPPEGWNKSWLATGVVKDEWAGGTYDPREQIYTTGVGQVITNIHTPEYCEGRPCVIHRPSDHHMRSWATNWRDGGMFDIKPPHMERLCEHGVGHPDPDDAAFHESRGVNVGVHGCDGCCHPDGHGYTRMQAGAGA